MYYFIINPNSRSGKGALIWRDLENILRERNIKYQTFFTEYKGHAVKLSASITASIPEDSQIKLIAVGGDGTIQEVLSGVKDISRVIFGYIPIYEVLTGIIDLSSVVFGFIPVGSGNDFCRSMKLPQDPMKALELILSDKRPHLMDVPHISCGSSSSRFAISCGIGFDAAVCHEVGVTPMKKVLNKIGLGKLVYLFVALKQLLFLKPSSMTLLMDDNKKEEFSKVYFTAIMNQKYEGGGFKFCPDASPSDGYLDVIVVDSLSKPKVICCLPTAFFGKHTHFNGIHIFRCKKIDIHSEARLAVHKDGESAGLLHDFSVCMEPKQINMIS